MFEEKLAILCDQKRQLIEDKDDKMVISAFFQIQNEFIFYFLFSRGACEGLNAMFADLILAFGLHAAKYSRGTLLLK